jgi:signal transduction histidine kinase/ActR/RegA family two-component response regulator
MHALDRLTFLDGNEEVRLAEIEPRDWPEDLRQALGSAVMEALTERFRSLRESDGPADPSPSGASSTVVDDSERVRILLVQHDPDVLTRWQAMLDPRWELMTASDSASAAVCLEANGPDLIIAEDTDCVAVVHRLRGTTEGRRIPILLVTSQIVDAGADDYLLRPFVARELRDRVRLQLALAARRDLDARATFQDRDDFLSTIGHELRNPLSTISMTVQTLRMRGPSSELALIERGVRQLTHLLDDLLESGRLARGTLHLHTTPIELAHIVDRTIETLTSLVLAARLQVVVSVPRVGSPISADPDRLVRALVNVLTNAIQHTPAGCRILISATTMDGRVRLTIGDEGTGIAHDQLGDMFQAFNANPSGGLGLGLMIARRLITLHGGTIDVASDGSGTLCTIDLPLLEQPWEESSPEPPAERRRLLLVEDNDDTARSLKAALEHLGYEVAVAHDAPIALNLARSFQPDVALLDLGLPVMDGWELARRLHEATAQLPIVAVTARDQEADKRRSAELGFVDHLVKPIDLPRLQKIVERVSASREES